MRHLIALLALLAFMSGAPAFAADESFGAHPQGYTPDPDDTRYQVPKTGLSSSQANIGNVGGKTVTVCGNTSGQAPGVINVTASNSYGINYVVGGLLVFPNAFTSTGTGILQGVIANMKKVETSGFTFVPFNSNPSNTTWTDAAVANINAADVFAVRAPVALSNSSILGTHTVNYAFGLGLPMAPGTTSLYGVLIANAPLTNQFGSTSDEQVCVKILQDM